MSNPLGLAYESDEEPEKDDTHLGYVDEQPEKIVVVDDVVATSGTSQDKFIGSGITTLEDTTIPIRDGNDVTDTPKVGMKFLSTEAVYEFYRGYAYREGFPIRIGSTKRGPDGNLRYYYLECSRSGNRESKSNDPSNPRPTGQTGCKAKICAVSDVLGVWRISTVKLEHNHIRGLTTSRLYACNRRLDPLSKRQLDMNDGVGIRVCKTFEAVAIDAGGFENITYNEKDCWNYVSKACQLRLGEGDAAALQAYFRRMQSQCPGFYFDIDMDKEGRLRNVFWADNRSREAYKEFGDVVSFDTTYLVNKYQIPFAPFVGVNHHGHSMLLGCGLLAAEDAKSFIWLFSAWLECMGGRAPRGIITDQDLAMKAVIPEVFPNTKHRWCLWHILKKMPEKLGGLSDKEAVIGAIKAAVYDTQFPDEFEDAWEEMLDKYQLRGNMWCVDMYSERARWVPCYLKTSFWAGMSTTQRSESMNTFFDGFVNSKTSLKQFVEQYNQAVRSKIEKEIQADHKSSSAVVRCATHFGIEKQFQQAYTNKKFHKEFQKEIVAVCYCRIDGTEYDNPGTIYRVSEQVALGNDHWKRREFVVSFVREDLLVSCTCNLFEFRGILCRHSLKVLIDLDIHQVHERYVLRRWRKDVHRAYTKITVGDSGWMRTPERERQDKLLSIAARMSELISVDKEYTDSVMELMEQKMRDFIISHPSLVGGRHCIDMVGRSLPATGPAEGTSGILDPPLVTCKGATKKNWLKRALEKNPKRKRVSSKKHAASTSQTTTLEQQTSNIVSYIPPPNLMVQGSVFYPPMYQSSSHVRLPPSDIQAMQNQPDQIAWRVNCDGLDGVGGGGGGGTATSGSNLNNYEQWTI